MQGRTLEGDQGNPVALCPLVHFSEQLEDACVSESRVLALRAEELVPLRRALPPQRLGEQRRHPMDAGDGGRNGPFEFSPCRRGARRVAQLNRQSLGNPAEAAMERAQLRAVLQASAHQACSISCLARLAASYSPAARAGSDPATRWASTSLRSQTSARR